MNQNLTLKTAIAAILFLFLSLMSVRGVAQSAEEKQLFDYMNSERMRENRMPLLWDFDVYKVALAHSKDMAAMGKATHTGKDGREPQDRVRRAEIYASKIGENIARDVNVISAHTLLMQSLYHRENILAPEFTHAAVAIVKQNQFLYITELFICKVGDHSLERARQTLVRQYNFYRQDKHLGPLVISDSLNKAAQAHAEMQKKFDSLTPMLTMSTLAKSNRGTTVVLVYTTNNLLEIPSQVRYDLENNSTRVGIGYKKIQGSLCNAGCYLIVVVLG